MLKTVGNPSTRTGNQTILNGNLIIGTAGKGIDFSADSHASGMTSELLDDYEEGTWTPVLTPAGGSITPLAAFTGGTYTKIGDLVTVNGIVYVSSVSSPTGLLSVTGLPFASKSGTQNYRAGTIYVGDMVATLNSPVQISLNPGSATLYISKIVNGAAAAISADVQAASDIRFSISYQV